MFYFHKFQEMPHFYMHHKKEACFLITTNSTCFYLIIDISFSVTHVVHLTEVATVIHCACISQMSAKSTPQHIS